MAAIWIVSEDSSLATTLELHLAELGETHAGPVERAAFREKPPADLIVVALRDTPAGDSSTLERLLGFLAGPVTRQRAPAPVLYLEPVGGRPSSRTVRELIDDRPVACLTWPPSIDAIRTQANALLERAEPLVGLRERSRRDWVRARVELLYGGVDLPELRRALDPHRAAQPVLLLGEPGTRKGLLARYIHQLAEPARDALVVLRADTLESGRVESTVLRACAGRRVTAYLAGLEAATAAVSNELSDLLVHSGALGIEAIRWIVSAHGRLPESLGGLPWIRVELPALRARPDRDVLVARLLERAASRQGQEVQPLDAALAALRDRAWLGNLRELEKVVEGAGAAPTERTAPAPPTESTPAASPVATSPASEGALPELLGPLSQELRQPLLAIRTYAGLLEQRPDDEKVRHDLTRLVEDDLPLLENLLARLERYANFSTARPQRVDLAMLAGSEVERIQPAAHKRSLVVLREFQAEAPAAQADEEQLRFALRGLLGQALRMVPEGGDLYIGTHHQAGTNGSPGRHRLLIRFHSPEEVLAAPAEPGGPGLPVELLMARALILRMGGSFAVDTSGAQDNVILIEIPA